MIWVKGNEHYIHTKGFTVTKCPDPADSSKIIYGAWKLVKRAPIGALYNPPISLGQRFATALEAQRACEVAK